MAKNDPVEKLLEVLGEMNAESLLAIDARMVAKEAEIEEATAKLRAELAGLQTLRKIVDAQVNGKSGRRGRKKQEPKAAPAPAATSPPGAEELRARLRALLKAKPGMILREISRELNEHHLRVLKSLQHEWFTETSEGWELR